MASPVVRVFPVDLDQPADVVERLDLILSEPERAVRVAVRVARAATRVVLGDALGVDPGAVPISRVCAHCGHPSHGRPTVEGGGFSFNLSHTGTFAVVALVAGDVRVGVDVEEVKARARIDALARRILNDEEHAAWDALDNADDRLRSFLRAWTAKESYLKAIGTGIITRLRDVPRTVDGWETRELELGADRIGALSLDRRRFVIRYADPPLSPSSRRASPRGVSSSGG